MLGIANVNRQRIDRRLDGKQGESHRGALRQAVIAEFLIGLVIVAITAAMVVSPPSAG
jgi:putative copper export protein